MKSSAAARRLFSEDFAVLPRQPALHLFPNAVVEQCPRHDRFGLSDSKEHRADSDLCSLCVLYFSQPCKAEGQGRGQ